MLSCTIRSLRKATLPKRHFSSGCDKGEVTSLYDFHVENGGKIVNFGGFLLPVQYNNLGIAASHLHTRKSASLFDVSHMLQTEITGNDCVQYLETIVTADLQGLPANSAILTVFTNEQGGILDDLIVTKIEDDHLFIVSNAARKQHDQQHFLKALAAHKGANANSTTKIRFMTPVERALIALQGPKAAVALQQVCDADLSILYFMNSTVAAVCGVRGCRVTRCGYTGEDGFEISIPAIRGADVARELLKNDLVRLAGLGARDSLRLEAGLCLYGSDITEQTTPVEAALTWLVSKRRRAAADFPGADVILGQVKQGSRVKRIGLVGRGGPPARHGAAIYDESKQRQLGQVTSGCPGPSVGANIAMGYVPTEFSKVGTRLAVGIRDKFYEVVVSKMPFVQSNYYIKPK